MSTGHSQNPTSLDLLTRQNAFDRVFARAPEAIVLIDTDDRILEINPEFTRVFGYALEEACGRLINELVVPEELLAEGVEFTRRGLRGESVDVETVRKRKDGTRVHVSIVSGPVSVAGSRVAQYIIYRDITERKRAEQRLRQSEEDLRTMADTIRQPIGVMAPDGTMLYVNRAALDSSGLTQDEAIKGFLARLLHPDDTSRVRDERRIGLLEGVPFDLEMRLLHKSGQYRWYLMQYNPLKDESGQIIRWYNTATDIDDRKRAEDRLRQSEEDLRAITDTIRQPISVLAPDGTMLYANRVALDNSGLTLDEVIKEDFIARVVHPDDVNRVRDEHRIGLLGGVPFDLESPLRFKSGQYRWQLIQYNPLKDESGQIIRWYVTITDIDDRKRAQEQVEQAYLRLAEAQRLSKTGSFITDLLVDDHDWSEEAFRIFEFEPTAKVTVQKIRDTIHPEDLPFFDNVIARGMQGIDVDFVFRIVTSRGALKHIRGLARVMEQIAGRPLFIGAFQDITERKLAEEALDRARSELAHVARVTTLNALTASIAHEVNQPLSGVITNASTFRRMLDADPPNIEGAREAARRAIRDGNRASDVITRLRTLFSKKEFTLEPLDLNGATEEVIAMSLSDLQRNRVILRSELAQDLPPVIGDRVQLQQVILNLLRNASDAMIFVEDRPRELLIRTERDEGDQVRLTVTDVGAGLTTENADKLFEAFYTTKKDGMGIGLSVSRSIIEAHKGRLWATPNDGPGATFQFTLPTDAKASATSSD